MEQANEYKDKDIQELEKKYKKSQAKVKQLQIDQRCYAWDYSMKLDAKDLKLYEMQEEVKTRGTLLKSCIDDLKIYVEELEKIKDTVKIVVGV